MVLAQELIYPQTESQLRKLQDDLYAISNQALESGENPKIKHLLEVIKSPANIMTAIHKIKGNKGSRTPGSDGQIMQKHILEVGYETVIERVQTLLDDYKLNLIKRKMIPKANKNELRPLGIPTIIDRIIQQCVKQIIEPILEAQFFNHSYGFRPMREAKHAIARISHMTQGTGYKWVVEGDISKFFDEVNHSILVKKLWNMGIRDQRVLMIIKKMLKAGILNEIQRNELGTPQGGIISPLLANVYLHKLDKWIVREWGEKKTRKTYSERGNTLKSLQRTNLKPAYFVRYADDWVLITNSKANAEKWKRRISKYLGTNLNLRLSDEKTTITNMKQKSIKFLGFEMKLIPNKKARKKVISRIKPDEEKLKAKIKKLHEEAFKLRFSSSNEWLIYDIMRYNSMVRGVVNYYQSATWVNIIMNKYNFNLDRAAYYSLIRNRRLSVEWVPAKEVDNLKSIHGNYTTQIPTVKYKGLKIGITSLLFSKWEMAYNKRQQETPYTNSGRKLYEQRTKIKHPLARADHILSEQYTRFIAKGMTEPIYNFEFVLNRAYALNRDKCKCNVCKTELNHENLETHHIRPYLPLDKINKVSNLVSLCMKCHNLVHSNKEISLGEKERKKIQTYREKLRK